MRYLIILFSLLLCNNLFAKPKYPDIYDKIGVKIIILNVAQKSRIFSELDEFGRNTMQESKEIISMGEKAVYALSLHMKHPDWKVRFWIVDIMGYLNNIDAQRPLKRVINNKWEKRVVKDRAKKSLKRLGIKK